MEGTIKESWATSFKSTFQNLDKDTTKEEIALIFFELGFNEGAKDVNSSISAAIEVLRKISEKIDRQDAVFIK